MATRPRRPAGRGRAARRLTLFVSSGLLMVSCGADSTGDTNDAARHAVAIRAVGCGPVARIGSGTMVGDDLVLTAAHPVAGADAIEVTDGAGSTRSAQIVRLDTVLDLAVIRAPGLDGPAVDVRSLTSDQTGGFVGADPDRLVPFTVVRPVDINFADIYDQGEHTRDGYELRAEVEPGDSGAGLIVDGRLGGVVFASSRGAADRAWATDIAAAEPILAGASVSSLDSPCVP